MPVKSLMVEMATGATNVVELHSSSTVGKKRRKPTDKVHWNTSF